MMQDSPLPATAQVASQQVSSWFERELFKERKKERKREREKEKKERETERERERARDIHDFFLLSSNAVIGRIGE